MRAVWQGLKARSRYYTTKSVEVRGQPCLTLVYYGVLSLVLLYIAIYIVVIQRGYQKMYAVAATASAAITGSVLVQDRRDFGIWDAIDLADVSEENALFIMTSYVITKRQERAVCSGTDVATEACNASQPNLGCEKYHRTKNGIMLGTCSDGRFCDIWSWCPIEDPTQPPILLDDVKHLNLSITTLVRFPELDGGVFPRQNVTALTLIDVVGPRGANLSWDAVMRNGAVVAMLYTYNCNLDWGGDCIPDIKYLALGRSFYTRRADYYYIDDTEARDMTDSNGVRLLFFAGGVGRKFSTVVLIMNIASGIALISVSAVCADFLATYAFKDKLRKEFIKAKYEVFNMDVDEFDTSNELATGQPTQTAAQEERAPLL